MHGPSKCSDIVGGFGNNATNTLIHNMQWTCRISSTLHNRERCGLIIRLVDRIVYLSM